MQKASVLTISGVDTKITGVSGSISYTYFNIYSRISLVVEHRTCNAEVVSSILTFGFGCID